MRLDDNTIVVTGASSGLGKAMADAFVEEGARVVYAARTEDRLAAAVEAVTDGDVPGEATAVPTDVRSWDDVYQLVLRTRELYGEIDVFASNAGVTQLKVNADYTRHPVADVPVTGWESVIDTNLTGAFYCTKAVLPKMLARDTGRLLYTSSGHGVSGRANRAPYVASKFGLEGLHETLALELEDTGVDSIAIRPPDGGVYTETSELYGRTKESYTNPSPDVVAEAAVQLAAGAGDNGGRYKATPEGDGFVEYSRTGR